MTSMKSFELAGRKTNQTAHSQTAGSTGLIGGLFGALGALFQRIEVSLEKSRVLAELERLDDRMLADIGLERGDLRAKVENAPVKTKPSLMGRMARALSRVRTKQATIRQLRALPDAVLRDIRIERGQIEDVVTATLTAKEAEQVTPFTREPRPSLAEMLVLPLRQWDISRRAASQMVRIDPDLLQDIGYVKGDIDWVPEVMAERRLKTANVNRRHAEVA
jgi:uncharacterized protein YjiS (DUF1127 family)